MASLCGLQWSWGLVKYNIINPSKCSSPLWSEQSSPQPKQSEGNPWLVLLLISPPPPPTSQSEETQKTNKEWNPNLLIQLKDNKIVLAQTRQIRGVRRRHPPPTLHPQSRFRMGNFYSLAWLRIGKIIELLNFESDNFRRESQNNGPFFIEKQLSYKDPS